MVLSIFFIFFALLKKKKSKPNKCVDAIWVGSKYPPFYDAEETITTTTTRCEYFKTLGVSGKKKMYVNEVGS